MNIATLITSQGTPSISKGLVLYWPLNENTGSSAYDFSGYINHGKLTGSVLPAYITTSSKGSPYITINNVASHVDSSRLLNLTPSGSYTISTWFKCTSITTNDFIIGNDNYATDRNGFGFVVATSPNICFEIGGVSTSTLMSPITGSSLNDNAWRMLTCTFNTTSLKCYINGILSKTSSFAALPIPNVNLFRIGLDGGLSQHLHNGSLDEVRVYDRILNPDEVYILYKDTGG